MNANTNNVCPLTGKPCTLHKQIHINEQQEDGSSRELQLCNMCGGKYLAQLDAKNQEPLPEAIDEPEFVESNMKQAKILHEFLQFVLNPPESFQKHWKKSACPECSWTIEDIRRTSKLGCPSCWQWYQNELAVVLKHDHAGHSKHVGKVPKSWKARQEQEKLDRQNQPDPAMSPEGQLRRLERKLKDAIKKEAYEDAAILRDAIKNFKADQPAS